MRYAIAAVIACVVIGAGFGFGRYLKHAFIQDLRRNLKAAKAEGKLPKELENADLGTFNLEGWEIRLPEGAERKLRLADWLLYGWHLWVPATIIISMTIAYATKGRAAP
jgi:hypothetical protein